MSAMRFIALCWNPSIRSAPLIAPPSIANSSADCWAIALETPGVIVLTAGPQRPALRWVAQLQGLVIGDLYSGSKPASDEPLSSASSRDPVLVAKQLVTSYWGRYVAVLRPSDLSGPSVLRDPSGAVEALIWRSGNVTVVASTLPDFLLAALPPKLSLDREHIASWLESPAAIAGSSGLAGIHALAPGSLSQPGQADTQVWRPVDWINTPPPPNDELPTMVEGAVDRVVRALSSDRRGILVEVSGGLDSSIVAAALAAGRHANVVQWLNYRAASGEGDERVFARNLANALAFELAEAEKPDYVLTERKLADISRGVRPGLSGLDCERDVDIGMRAKLAGADTIFTGQGGDMVFFQSPSPLVAADLFHLRGLRGLVDPSLVNTARWLRKSVWSLAMLAWSERRGRRLPVTGRPSFLVDRTSFDGAAHPWLVGLEEVPPAKRLQVCSLVEKLTLYGENRRSLVADVIHPLLAQPIMELCLRTPTPVLTSGGRDRGLARQAFSHRLPDAIAGRRTKGSLGGYYARTVAGSLAFLRPFLLEGRLAQMNMINVARLEALLTREQLIIRGDYPSILFTALVESWVREWESRISSLHGRS